MNKNTKRNLEQREKEEALKKKDLEKISIDIADTGSAYYSEKTKDKILRSEMEREK